LIIESLMHFIW